MDHDPLAVLDDLETRDLLFFTPITNLRTKNQVGKRGIHRLLLRHASLRLLLRELTRNSAPLPHIHRITSRCLNWPTILVGVLLRDRFLLYLLVTLDSCTYCNNARSNEGQTYRCNQRSRSSKEEKRRINRAVSSDPKEHRLNKGINGRRYENLLLRSNQDQICRW